MRRKTPEDYHQLAARRGFEWLGPEAPNTTTKTAWQCQEGHQWQATYSSIQQGTGCPHCSGRAPKTAKDYYALAGERGFTWLEKKVTTTHTKTTWQCQEGHQWQAAYHNIQNGSGCPHCAGLAPKTSADYRELAEERGFKWLGPEVPNTQTKTTWRCRQGHLWRATYNNISQGKGCPYCAGKAPKTPEDYRNLARQRGFQWLGPMVDYNHIPTMWQCHRGHRWQANFGNISHGSGCPHCAGNAPKAAADYRKLARTRSFKWLGPMVQNVLTRTRWQCDKDHKWWARYNSIQQGAGCPFCRRAMN